MRWRDSRGTARRYGCLKATSGMVGRSTSTSLSSQCPNDVARVRWNEYAEDEREEAIRAFEEVEAAIEHFPGADTVLVRVASIETLRDAYPSYFADTRVFVDRLKSAIG